MEMAAANWLKYLGFKGLFLKVNRPIFEDPLRNGVLLINLVKTLEFKPPIVKFFSQPHTVEECRNNIEQALLVLRNNETKIPVQLLHLPEEIVKGNCKVFWGIIFYLM